MPNWCENSVKLSGLEEETVSTIARNIILADNPFPEFLRVLHPVPDLRERMTDEVIELSAKKKGKQLKIILALGVLIGNGKTGRLNGTYIFPTNNQEMLCWIQGSIG